MGKSWREALGMSLTLTGGMTTVIAIAIGIIKIIELGFDRFYMMLMILSFTVPMLLIGYWLLRPYLKENIVKG